MQLVYEPRAPVLTEALAICDHDISAFTANLLWRYLIDEVLLTVLVGGASYCVSFTKRSSGTDESHIQ